MNMGSIHKLQRSKTYDNTIERSHHHRHDNSSKKTEGKNLDSFDDACLENKIFIKKYQGDAVRYRDVFKNARKQFGKPIQENHKIPWPCWETVAVEENLIKNPTTAGFFEAEQSFNQTMLIAGHQKYVWLNDIMIDPSENSYNIDSDSKSPDLERWHKKHKEQFEKNEDKEIANSDKRLQKIAEKGPGFGGKMTTKIAKSKAASFYAKNNLTIRGNVFKLTHQTCPKNIYEMMPRFGYRKSAHVGVRISQFALNGILAGVGYALAPVTFGVSKIVTNSLSTVVTLTGESITHKIEGAEKRKITVHAGLRGVQLEVPLFIPVVGNFLYMGDSIALGGAAVGIVSTTIADAILHQFSTRYASTMNADDLGNSRCLEELNHRIDYLSRFLLPYGQYLLLKETDIETRQKLKTTLKSHFKTLRILEKKKVESLNFYRLALAAEKIPKDMVDKIQRDCKNALPDTRVNTHKIAKRCLATLIKKDESLENILSKKNYQENQRAVT
jgi:hypothetical protein